VAVVSGAGPWGETDGASAIARVPYGDPTRTVPAEGEAITNQGSVPIGTRRAKDPLSRLKAHNAESYP